MRPGAQVIATDVSEAHWLQDIPTGRPAVIVFDGLVAFLSQADLIAILNRLVDHFPSGELAFNAYTKLAIRALTVGRVHPPIAGAVANPGFNDPRTPENWVPGLTLIEEILLTRAAEVAELPASLHRFTRVLARSRWWSRMLDSTVLRYGF